MGSVSTDCSKLHADDEKGPVMGSCGNHQDVTEMMRLIMDNTGSGNYERQWIMPVVGMMRMLMLYW